MKFYDFTLYLTSHEYIDLNKVKIYGYERRDYILFNRNVKVEYIGTFKKVENKYIQYTNLLWEWNLKSDISYDYVIHNLEDYAAFKIQPEIDKKIDINKILRRKKLDKIKNEFGKS